MKHVMSKKQVVEAILNDTEKHVTELDFDSLVLDAREDANPSEMPVYYPEITEELVSDLKQTVKNIHVMHSNARKAKS